MSAITIGGDLIHYEVLGRGRPVLLIHGWIGSWRYWVPTMQHLQTNYRVYALDLYGFGDTGKNPQKYALDHQVQLLHDFMNSMAIPKAAFIGHGLGALVVTEFARLYPDKAPRIMLISAPLFDPGDLEKRIPAGRSSVPLTNNKPAPVAPVAAVDTPPDATIMNANNMMREALLERQRAQAISSAVSGSTSVAVQDGSKPKHNPLATSLANVTLEALLAKCFKRSEPTYDKLNVDLAKTDMASVKGGVSAFDSGRMLDTVRLLPMPRVIVHGVDDAVIPVPNENVWNYVTAEKEELLLPIPIPGVRHFPMLEYERFTRLVTDFLEVPDISKLEIKERWKRRTR
jgi:pimeloyl-ACP methyl ester carboxylesterase